MFLFFVLLDSFRGFDYTKQIDVWRWNFSPTEAFIDRLYYLKSSRVRRK